jgi:hypothetical protein
LIVSIAYLSLARLRWARREINGAIHYFDLVRKLEVLADEIPTQLDDHEVVMGTVALFEKDHDGAVKHFTAAVTAAQERGKATTSGRLGLLLCQWRKEEWAGIDQSLGEVLQEMRPQGVEADQSEEILETACPHCGKAYHVRSDYLEKKVQCKGCRRRFTVQQREKKEEQEVGDDQLLSEDELLLRNARLWHCLTRIVHWLSFKPKSGLPEAEYELLHQRLRLVQRLDKEFGDPFLIGGLVDYYFAANEQQRTAGRRQLEQAVERDVHLPEVLQLLDRIHKLAQLAEGSLGYFHEVAKKYATDPEVDPGLRRRFVENMNRRAKFSELGAIESLPSDQAAAPSLVALQGRVKILQNRVSNIVRSRLQDAEQEIRDEITRKLEEVRKRNHELEENAAAVQKSEFGLMESTGEFLFSDEVPMSEDSGEKANGDTN